MTFQGKFLPQNWRDRQANTENHNLLEEKPMSRNLHRKKYWGVRKAKLQLVKC